MAKNKTDQFFIGSSRINLSDEDLIARPHGYMSSEESLTEEVRKLTKELKGFKNRVSRRNVKIVDIIEKAKVQNSKILSKRDLKKKFRTIIKTIKLGKKEKELADLLADFEKHKTKDIIGQVKTKAHRKLKQKLKKKLRGTGFSIKTPRSDGLFSEYCYQLDYLTDTET